MFAGSIVLVGENPAKVNRRLDQWGLALKGKRLIISRIETKYIE